MIDHIEDFDKLTQNDLSFISMAVYFAPNGYEFSARGYDTSRLINNEFALPLPSWYEGGDWLRLTEKGERVKKFLDMIDDI
jgi:hypothetical protein